MIVFDVQGDEIDLSAVSVFAFLPPVYCCNAAHLTSFYRLCCTSATTRDRRAKSARWAGLLLWSAALSFGWAAYAAPNPVATAFMLS